MLKYKKGEISMSELTISDYKNAFENKTCLRDIAKSAQCINGGSRGQVPVLVFKCDGFSFFMLHTDFPFSNMGESASTAKTMMALVKLIGSEFGFGVVSFDEKNHRGLLKKAIYDVDVQRRCFTSQYGTEDNVAVDDIVDFQVIAVTQRNVTVTGLGVTEVLDVNRFPNIRNKNLLKVFQRNEMIPCRVKKISPPTQTVRQFTVEIDPVEYPQATEDTLKENSYYFGEIIALGKKEIFVDCDGKIVLCKYPYNYVPVNHTNVNVQITEIKPNPNEPGGISYRGRIIYCELPFGTY
jgi:hypothetical protein